jgi:predicted phage-related endonuclease
MTIQPIPRDRQKWLAMRRTSINASEMATLFDGAKAAFAASPFALYQIKSGLMPETEIPDNDRMRWGRRLECFIAIETAAQEGFKIRKGVYATDDTTPGIAATLDFCVPKHPLHASWPGQGALEVKNVDWLTWKKDWGESPTFQIEIQLQTQLCSTGWAWGIIAVLVGGNDLHVFYRKARPRMIDAIRARATAFWDGVRAGVPPDVDGSDSTTAALRALYPAPPADEEAECPDDMAEDLHAAASQFLTEREMRLSAAPREEAVKNLLRVTIGSAKLMRIPPPDFNSPAYLVTRSMAGTINVKETRG